MDHGAPPAFFAEVYRPHYARDMDVAIHCRCIGGVYPFHAGRSVRTLNVIVVVTVGCVTRQFQPVQPMSCLRLMIDGCVRPSSQHMIAKHRMVVCCVHETLSSFIKCGPEGVVIKCPKTLDVFIRRCRRLVDHSPLKIKHIFFGTIDGPVPILSRCNVRRG